MANLFYISLFFGHLLAKFTKNPKVIGLIHLPWIVITDRNGPVRMIKINHYPNNPYDKRYLINLVKKGRGYKLMFNTGRFLCASQKSKYLKSCKSDEYSNTTWRLVPGRNGLFAIKRNGKCLRKLPKYNDGFYSGYILKIGKCKARRDYKWLIKDIIAEGKSYPPDNSKPDDDYDDDVESDEKSEYRDELSDVREPQEKKDYVYKPASFRDLLSGSDYNQYVRVAQPVPTGKYGSICNLENFACGVIFPMALRL